MASRRTLGLAACWVAAFTLLAAQDSPDSFQTRREIGMGIRAFRTGHYDEAAQHFQKAIAMDPESINPRLYLATSYASMYTPGSTDPANLEFIHKAEVQYLKVLELNPEEDNALRSLATLAYERAGGMTDPVEKREQLRRAAGWYRQVGAVSPKDQGAFYMLGVIAWSECEPDIQQARLQAGMKPETPPPIPSTEARAALEAGCGEVIDDGIAQLNHALELDPDYDEAMSYLSLLNRQRANFAPTPEAAADAVKQAGEWTGKAAEARKRRASAPARPSDQ